MANENKKDFNKKMNDSKDMPKIVELNEEAAIKWKGKTMIIAPPKDYDEFMKKVPEGKLITTDTLRKAMAKKYKTDITCPLTCGIFVNICAWASYQRNEDKTPYWRTLKSDGELNVKYPEGIELQKELLEKEGHEIISKGKKNIKYYVKDFEKSLIELK